MRNVIQKIILIGISVSILLGSLSNVTTADHEQKNILKENLSNLITKNKTANEKLEQAVENLIKGNRVSYDDKIKQINAFDFVGEKVRLEIILSDKDKLDLLTAFNENIIIESSYENLVQALVPVSVIESLSKEQFVKFIQKPIIAHPCVESEGVGVINADDVHNRGFYGDGVKVAIIDIGFTGYASNPEIPSQNIKEVKSFRGDGQIETSEHGSACTEIVLDVAPHADLYLYVIGTDVEFCNALSYAVSKGINIVSVSLGFFNVNDLDGTGTICTAVNSARAADVLVCISSGNNAESHYCGWYVDNDDDDFHDFDTGYEYLDLGYLPAGYPIDLHLSWNDWSESDQDYDLYLGRDGDIYDWVDYSENEQTGSQPPTEEIGVYAPASDYYYVCIIKYFASSSVRFQLFSYYCYFYDNNHPETSLSCPSDATEAMAVGATYWQNDNLESFSSRGPTNDARTKPDVTAPDSVSTSISDYNPFNGTSASTPHVAGAAALLKSVNSSLTANQLQTILETTAVPLGASGKDNLYGSGRIDVLNAFNSATVNIRPVAYADNYTTAEDITLTVSAPGVLTNDTDGDGDTLTAVKVTNPSHGTVTSFPGTGAFIYVPTSNYYGADSFTYKAYDGTVYSNIATVYILVTSVNDAPVVTDIPSQTIAEGSTFTTISLDNYVSDVDNTDAEMTWTYSGNSQLTVGIAARVATITIPNLNWSGAETIIFRATDPGNLWDDDTATFTVTAVNDAPVVSGIPDQTIAEGSTFTTINLDDYVTDVDNTDAQMTWTKSGNSQLTVSILSRVATITIPSVDWNGAETITFRATDPGSLWSQDAAVFTVTAVNDAPVVGDIPSQTVAEGSTFTTISLDNYVFDVDNTDAQMTWTYSGNVQLTVSIVNRVATISIPNVNWYGVETITFRATDPGGLWDDDSAVFTVTSVNDVPVANFTYLPSDPSVGETIHFTDTSTDIDGTVVSWSWNFGDGSTSTLQNPIHRYNDDGTHSVSLQATDNNGGTNTIIKNVYVLPNNVPIINSTYPVNSATNISFSGTPINTGIYDADNDNLWVEIWSNHTGTWIQYASSDYSEDAFTRLLLDHDENGGWDASDSSWLQARNGWGLSGSWGFFLNQSVTDDWGMNTSCTTYYWSLNVTDNKTWTNETFHFTTQSKTVYVDDDADPSWYNSTQVRTIQEGINNASNGDTVFVYNGTFHENVILNKTILFIGENKTETIIDAGGFGSVVNISARGANISRFTLRNGGSSNSNINYPDAGMEVRNDSVIIYDNLIMQIGMYGIFVINSSEVVISENNLTNNEDDVIFLYYSDDNTISGNKVQSNDFSGIVISHSGNNLIYDNIVTDNGEYGILIGGSGSNNNTVHGNTIMDNINGGINLSQADNLVYDNYFDNTVNAVDTSGNNIWNVTKTAGTNIIDGSYLGGNYWNNYTGVDTDGDGLGNTHTPFGPGDYHPLTEPNYAPQINFTYAPANPTVDDIVFFNDTSIDIDGTVVSWHWDFDDGSTSTLRNTTHQFLDNITYIVTLNVTDNDGANSSITKQVVTRIIYTNITQENTTTIINLQDETSLIITINTTEITTINVSKYSGNPTGKNITGDITVLGTFISIEADNESAIRWPINISIFYTQDDLNNSNLNESQLLGIYFWNDTAEEWHLYNNTGVNASYSQSGYEGYCWANAWHLTILAPGGDNETPSKVTGLTVTDAKDGKLNLAWTAATDNVVVDHYRIYRDNAPLINISSPTISYQDTGLTNGHSYTYNVSAVDSSGNEGIRSDSVNGTPTASGGGGNPPGDGGFPPMGGSSNDPPIANLSAGKPYVGFVGSPVTFDGSWSNDTDGNITQWVWNFGDGTNTSGQIVTHIYSKLGVYTVTLTVTDNDNATDSDTTTVVIRVQNKSPSNPTIDGPPAGHKNINYSYTVRSTDANNDTIKYTFHWNDSTIESSEFLSNGTSWTRNHSWTTAGKCIITVTATDNQTNSSSEKTIWIDAVSVDDIGYLIDIDGDGIYNSFHNETNGKETSLGQKDGDYLIDSDGDGKWDYAFDATKGLTPYQQPKTPGFELIFIIVAITFMLLWKRKRKDRD